MLKQEGGKWCAYNEKGTRSFGCYDSKEKAEERLRQMEYFKKIHKHVIYKIGTEASGFQGHAGRTGRVGGSLPRGHSVPTLTTRLRAYNPEQEAAHQEALARRRERGRQLKRMREGLPPETSADADRQWALSILSKTMGDSAAERDLKFTETAYDKILGDKKTMPLSTFVRQAYEITDPESGLHTTIRLIEAGGVSNTKVIIKGKVLDSNNFVVGSFTRYMETTTNGVEVHNDFFDIQGNYQGKGFGSLFYRNAESVYEKAGVDAITIYANIDVGGYAWARMGFDFVSGSTLGSYRDSVIQKLNVDYSSSDPVLKTETDRVRGFTHAWEIAAYKAPNGNSYGKNTLLGNSWYAVKYLKPDAEGYKVGRTYYDLKDKQKKSVKK